MNAVDQQRTIREVEGLLLFAIRLGHGDDVHHWKAVLAEKRKAAR